MTSLIRRQLTLFVEPTDAVAIEQIRHTFNPRQFEIIKAHVTLCREDEIEDLEQVTANLLSLIQTQPPLCIQFGKVARFDNGKGLFLPALPGHTDFDGLRRRILWGVCEHPKAQMPHITLMHPRNATCTDSIFEHIGKMDLPTQLEFKRISLIEQENGGQWKTLEDFAFIH